MSNEIQPLMSILNQRYQVAAPKPVTQGANARGVNGPEFTPTVNYSDPNLFAGNLTGVNTNIGIGDYQDAQAQAGRKLGGRTIAFA